MSAVLLGSRRAGISGWAAVRRYSKVRISGMGAGDVVMLHFRELSRAEVFDKDTEIEIPEGTMFVRAQHESASGKRVFVELVN